MLISEDAPQPTNQSVWDRLQGSTWALAETGTGIHNDCLTGGYIYKYSGHVSQEVSIVHVRHQEAVVGMTTSTVLCFSPPISLLRVFRVPNAPHTFRLPVCAANAFDLQRCAPQTYDLI